MIVDIQYISNELDKRQLCVGWVINNEFHIVKSMEHKEYLKDFFPDEYGTYEFEMDQYREEEQEHLDWCIENDEHPGWHAWSSSDIEQKLLDVAAKNKFIRFGIFSNSSKHMSLFNRTELNGTAEGFEHNKNAIDQLYGLGVPVKKILVRL